MAMFGDTFEKATGLWANNEFVHKQYRTFFSFATVPPGIREDALQSKLH